MKASYEAVFETCAWGLLLELTLLIFANITKMDRTKPLTTFLFYLPFALFTLAFIRLTRITTKNTKATVFLILLFSSLFTLTFIRDRPNLSDDLYRYYWDGKVSCNGINPYIFPPESRSLAHLRDEYWTLINNKDLTTPYPPFIEALFATLYLLSPSIHSYKLLAAITYIASSYILLLILGKCSKSLYYSLLYSWNPLMVIEFGHSGHNDSVAVLFMLVSTFFLLTNKYSASAATLGIATLSKIFPIFLTPFYATKWGIKNTILYFSIIILPYLPLSLKGSVQTSLITYFERIAFNSGAYYLVEKTFAYFAPANSMFYARITVSILFIISLLYLTKRSAKVSTPYAAYTAITLYLIFTPTVQPWYLSWVLPFAALYTTKPWLYFSGAVFLSYYTYTLPEISPGFWPEQLWVRVVEYVPFFYLLIRSFKVREFEGC